MTDITYPHLHATHFDYDADGRKLDMTDATGTTSWSYGADGVHLCQLANPQGTITYQYDGDGRQSEKYANVTNLGIVSYWYTLYDPAGLLHSVRSTLDGTTTYAYDQANRLQTQTNANGDVSTYSYDTTNEVTDIVHATSAGVKKTWMHYGYDPAGSVQSEDYNSGNTTTYGYDGADQLTSEVQTVDGGGGVNYSEGFTYDGNGNRLTKTQNGSQVQNFTYDGHDKVATAAGETDGYDAAGNQTSVLLNGSTSTRTFDDEDRLTSITIPGVGTDTFTYNGLGLRVGKADSTGTFSFLCDGASPASPVLWDGYAVYTPGLSENRGGTTLYNHADLLGSLVELTDSQQQPTNAAEYDGFGSITSSWLGQNQVPSVTPFKFGGGNGCQSDADTGLVLMGHRYYDPRTGRFLSQDPAGDGDNWYAYADNSPTNETDPTGLFTPPYNNLGAGGGMDGTGQMSFGASSDSWITDGLELDTIQKTRTGTVTSTVDADGHITHDTVWGPWGPSVVIDRTPLGGGMFAEGLTLPENPSGLPNGWELDPSHRPPDGSRHRGPNGEGLDYQKGREGKPGFEGQDHWHKLRLNDKGKWETDPTVGRRGGHLLPGDVVKWGTAGLVLYGLYEGVKWGGAILLAPESGGLSLGAAALAP